MNNIIISTEATCDLNKEITDKYAISVAPMHFMLDEKEFSSNDNQFTFDSFYQSMKNGQATKTSQINEYEAKEYLENLLKQNPGKDILHLSVSSRLSGQVNNFVKASEELNLTSKNKIVVVDTLSGSFAQGLLCIMASEMASSFNDVNKLAEYIDVYKHKVNALFSVDDLKYLYRNGRLSKISVLIGSLLKIKPYLHLDKEGKLAFVSKVISRKKALQTIANNTIKYASEKENKIVIIAHALCKEDAEFVKAEIECKSNLKAIIYDLGIVIGSHSGPGTISTFFISDERH